MEKQEIWKEITGYEGFYEASSQGRVRSIPRLVFGKSWTGNPMLFYRKSVVLSAHLCMGYPRLILSRDNRKQKYHVHVLVCEAFNGTRPQGKIVAHINGVRTDNRPENLMWATYKENSAHQLIHGTRPLGVRHSNAKLNPEKIAAARAALVRGEKQSDLARSLGVARSTLRAAIMGQSWVQKLQSADAR